MFSVTSLTNCIPESAGTVTISFSRHNAIGNYATIEIAISGAPVDTSGTNQAKEGVDFLLNGVHQVIFEPNSIIAEFTIPIIQDTDIEYDEEFYVDIVEPAAGINGGRSRTIVTIKNDDAYIQVENPDITIPESVGHFKLLLHRGPFMDIPGYLDNDVTIVVSTNSFEGDTAIAGYDTVGDFESSSKTVTFYGRTRDFSKTSSVTIIDDDVIEEDETFTISLSGNVNIAPESRLVKVTILDDDGRFALDVPREVVENQGQLEFTVTRSGLKGSAHVVVRVIGGSAREGLDFNGDTYDLVFLPGENVKTGTITLIDDNVPEENKMFRIELVEADGEIDENHRDVTVTIIDDDVTTFGFEHTAYAVGESCQTLKVTVVKQGIGHDKTTLRK
ncbi:FRAS1-related extracellular matrix protein 3-like [Amphiura filiformis]|uniref:FRAS1-related extracellular matrix protein 3-like n=1 Tax=Amphiura filiformis TaxID=82378 RepID=UPI003B20DBC3